MDVDAPLELNLDAPLEPIAAFLAANGLGDHELRIEPIGNGHSNLSFALIQPDRTLVLRRPPRPPFPPSAHDVLREARIIAALRPAGMPVPEVLAFCDDDSLIGVPFYVMEYVDGAVLDTTVPAGLSAAEGSAIGAEFIAGLVKLHSLDPALAGLGPAERADSYLSRQVERFSAIWAAVKTRSIPEMDEIARWLRERLPTDTERAIVHGDYRLGNTIFDLRSSPQLAAVLDWEMAALGDPLADLGYMLATWTQAGDPETSMSSLSRVTRAPGFPTRAELRSEYERLSGRSTDGIDYYQVLALWKSAAFLESSYRRFIEGRAPDQYFATLKEGVPEVAGRALSLTD
jgi:aminoglycoside phosphotransferase (APT) family kinase protein